MRDRWVCDRVARWCVEVHTGLVRAHGRVANDCTVVHTGMYDETKLSNSCQEWETEMEFATSGRHDTSESVTYIWHLHLRPEMSIKYQDELMMMTPTCAYFSPWDVISSVHFRSSVRKASITIHFWKAYDVNISNMLRCTKNNCFLNTNCIQSLQNYDFWKIIGPRNAKYL